MISVALCTYNGERYIEEQICSIINQTYKVDEIVVCDDGSTDKTVEIINNIITKHNAPINLNINEKTLRVCSNFEKAVSLCHGNIIFLSDQDDVWKPNKVETLVSWFAKHPDKSVVFTDAELIGENGSTLHEGKSLWQFTGFQDGIRRQFDAGYAFELVASQNRCTGATMALRKDFVFDFAAYCNSRILHDDVIAVAAAMKNQLGYLDAELIKYRVHQGQVAGIDETKSIVADKYSVNSKAEAYLQLQCAKEMRERLSLFVLRANTPRKSIARLFCYLCVYGIEGMSFWWHDIVRVVNGKMSSK